MKTTSLFLPAVVATCLVVSACGSSSATDATSTHAPGASSIKLHPGRYQYQLGNQLNVGDKVICVAAGRSAGGGVVPTPGQGVGSSTGFRLQVAPDGTVNITCPASPSAQ